jgi:pimeloyl-ACP methyl ester carboxylesterase
MTTYVLVHGAWHGGWCWQRVAKLLREKSHDVYTPTLTGVGDRLHLASPDINTTTQITDVVNLIKFYDLDDVVLCGHSYGGVVITGVADQLAERVRTLVYLDAIIPQHGKSMMDLTPEGSAEHNQALADEIDGYSVPPMTAEVFNVNDADAAWVDAKCTNHPIGCFTEVISLTGNHATVSSRTFILAEDFEFDAIRNSYEKVKDDPAWNVMTMEGGHELMVDKPVEVANVLLDLG